MTIALLVDTKGQVKRSWKFPYVNKHRGPRNLNIASNGTLVSNASDVLRAASWCGQDLWLLDKDKGYFHHEIDIKGDEILVWRDNDIVSVSVDEGQLQVVTSIEAIKKANPDHLALKQTEIGGEKYVVENDFLFKLEEQEDGTITKTDTSISYHPNKVASNNGLAKQFPADALMVSLRNLNLVAIIDRSTSKILWHFNKLDMQHDPDWSENGVLVYNNGTYRKNSTVDYVSFDKELTTIAGAEPGVSLLKNLAGANKFHWFRGFTGNKDKYNDGSMVFQVIDGVTAHIESDGKLQTLIVNWYKDNHILINRNTYFIDEENYQKFEKQCES
jgi:hypothetical protein